MLTEVYPADFSGFIQVSGFVQREGNSIPWILRAHTFNTSGFDMNKHTRPLTHMLSSAYSHCLANITLESALSNLEGGRCLPPSWLRDIPSWCIVWVTFGRILHFSLCRLMWSWSKDPNFEDSNAPSSLQAPCTKMGFLYETPPRRATENLVPNTYA